MMTSGTLGLSYEELQAIAWQAASLPEREGQNSGEGLPDRQDKVESRLREWREAAAGGDGELFSKRLSFDGLDPGRARSLLGMGKAIPEELPPWTGVLNEVLRFAASLPAGREDLSVEYPFLDKDAPIPFEELFLPFIGVVRERMAASHFGYGSMPDGARACFERALAQRLSGIASLVLLVEFRTFLACGQFGRVSSGEPMGKQDCRGEYRRFIEETCRKGWLPIFREYCVLARLMATALNQWVESTGEFLARLSNDLPRLERTFPGAGDAGAIRAVETDLSDAHNGGRTVVAVEFASGTRLIYKPKEMALEVEYFRLVAWLNGLGSGEPLRCLRILNSGGYGWVEYIDNAACEDEAAVRRFYRRSGAFLALVHALNGIDFHFENLIACGEQPVPVDLETIYHHVTRDPAEDAGLTDAVAARLKDSVLRTHMLPNPVKVKDRYHDISAIARSAEAGEQLDFLTWQNINTDNMSYNYEKVSPGPAANLPRLGGACIGPDDYVGEIVAGFRQMYGLLREQKETLVAGTNPFRRIFACGGRFIFRATVFYLAVLRRALHPEYLRDGVDFDIQLDALARGPAGSGEKPVLWPLIADEKAALWRLDVPSFTARGDDDHLVLPSGEVVAGCFASTAWESVRAKLDRFGPADLEWQVGLINGSMDARDAKRLTDYPAEPWPAGEPLPAAMSRTELLATAEALGREIEAAALYSATGEPGWLVLKFLPEADQFALRAMEFDLYNGRCGVALFLAALEKTLPGAGFGRTAYGALALVRRWLERAGRKDIEAIGIGGLVGVPSLAYTLVRAGSLLGDGELVAEARRAALMVGQKQIEADRLFDVLGGAAGTILCLLACHRATGDGEILDRAASCGRHLVAGRMKVGEGFKTWATLGGRNLAGFSHGAAGIAYALLKLYEATGEKEYYAAAVEGIDYENSLFVASEGNWPDNREYKDREPEAGPAFMTGWCHGAPGIGLARLGGLTVFDSPAIGRDIAAALKIADRADLLPRDHICCGNMGLTETLIAAGIRLAKAECTARALALASKVAARAKRQGSFGVRFRNGFFNPSLFQGASGVGYQFLRLACPQEVPSVLLLE